MNKKLTFLYISVMVIAVMSSLISQSDVVSTAMSVVLFITLIAVMMTPDKYEKLEELENDK